MSVINQMLRDLDARDASEQERAGLPPRLRTLPPAVQPRRQQWRMLALGIGIGAASASLVAWLLYGGAPPAPSLTTVAVSPAPTFPAPPVTQPTQLSPAVVADDGAMKLSTLISKPEADSVPAPVSPPVASAKPAQPAKPASPPVPANEPAKSARPAAAPAEAKPPTVPAPEPAIEAQIDKRTKGGSTSDLAEAEYRKGMQAMKRGDAAAALPAFQKALELDPRLAKARQALLSVLVGGKQWDEARQVAEAGLALDPAQSGWATILARLQFEQGDTAAAVATLERHAAAAGDADYQGLFAYLLQKQQRPAEAAERFKLALGLRPNEGRWWFGLGLALETAGKVSEAREAYAKARETGNLPADMAAIVEQRLK